MEAIQFNNRSQKITDSLFSLGREVEKFQYGHYRVNQDGQCIEDALAHLDVPNPIGSIIFLYTFRVVQCPAGKSAAPAGHLPQIAEEHRQIAEVRERLPDEDEGQGQLEGQPVGDHLTN